MSITGEGQKPMRANPSFRNAKAQKGLADDDFIAVFQRLSITGDQPSATIYKGPVG
jgi:hypothetical protein